MRKADKYHNFAELERGERRGAWRVRTRVRDARVLIIAPHGGGIEPGTSKLATLIAGQAYSQYRFEGLKPRGNRDLHITSHHFDQREAVVMAERSSITLGIHGCEGHEAIFVGGLDVALRGDLTMALARAGFHASAYGHEFPAEEPNNICNRNTRGAGAQLEISYDLRASPVARASIARVAREVIAQHLALLGKGEHSGGVPLRRVS